MLKSPQIIIFRELLYNWFKIVWRELKNEFPRWRSVDRYLLTSWCRVLLEKLTGLKLVKKFPAFHGT